MTKYLGNGFSLQMVAPEDLSKVRFEPVAEPMDKSQYVSIIGHADMAQILGVPLNRISVTLKAGDELWVCQLTGGRLPEGATQLPEGFKFIWVKVIILD